MDIITQDMVREIERIVKDGNTVEIKKVNGNLVLVEIDRKMKIKTPITG